MTAELKEMRTLGRRVRKLRKEAGYTKVKLAAKTGLSVDTIARIEGADESGYNPHLDTLAYVAAGLDVKVAELTNLPVQPVMFQLG